MRVLPMPLSDTAIRNAKALDKPVKLTDSQGLFLLVKPSTAKEGKPGKWWRFRYRFDGKEKMLSLGTYPDVSLKEAREKRDEARKLLSQGVDPSARRKAVDEFQATDHSFENVAREWFKLKSPEWADSHAKRIIARLEKFAFPWIGVTACQDLTAPEILSVLRRVESRGAIETAHRILQSCSQILRYAVITGRADRDVSVDLHGALATPKVKHFPALLEKDKVAGLLRAIDSYTGGVIVTSALKLAPMLFVRPGELRQMEWKDVDLEAAQWRFIASKTKEPHIVPLATQALAILQEIKPITGRGRYVFPSSRVKDGSRPMSEVALLAALRRMGIEKDEQTVHGFRALARTVLDEDLGYRVDLIEQQLAHTVKDPLGRAYNRTKHLTERIKMMQDWANYLEKIKNS